MESVQQLQAQSAAAPGAPINPCRAETVSATTNHTAITPAVTLPYLLIYPLLDLKPACVTSLVSLRRSRQRSPPSSSCSRACTFSQLGSARLNCARPAGARRSSRTRRSSPRRSAIHPSRPMICSVRVRRRGIHRQNFAQPPLRDLPHSQQCLQSRELRSLQSQWAQAPHRTAASAPVSLCATYRTGRSDRVCHQILSW